MKGSVRTSLLFAPLLLLFACGSDPDPSGTGSGGRIATGGATSSSGGTTSTGANVGTGGKAAGTSGGAGGATASGGSPATSGGAGGGGTSGLVDCDLRKVVCRSAVPECPQFQVPSVSGTCYGPCVPIDSCACSVAEECPYNEEYTCWRRMHCGPYVG